MIGKVSRDASPGALMQVLGKGGTPFGWGLWNHRSNMPLRIVSHSLEDLDESFFDDAIRRAAVLRREIHKLDTALSPLSDPLNGAPKRPTPKANF